MRYIIVSRERNTGKFEDDNSSLNNYFELGWEVSTTHLDTKFLLSSGVFNKSDIIVTQDGRKFFYDKLFDKVISCKEFELIYNNEQVIDMVANSMYNFLSTGVVSNKELVWNGQEIDKDILFSFNYSDLNPVKDYACLVYRRRNHEQHRNMNDTYFINLLDYLKSIGLDVYIVGYGAEKFVKDGVFYVDLRDWATLINKDKCKIIVTTLTGPTNLINFCGNINTNISIIELGASRENGENRIIMGECLNFKNLKFNMLKSLDFEELKKII